ncbi:MAG: precorrin-6y C5,15-methyltransferase (decarboxylating) subunit CbiE [Syntrophorhabdales bacterium]|jgi:precorrin-6Y C5,15-methyltransferase (decarboxylating)
MANKLTIIGIGSRPLDRRARQAIFSAETVVAARRLCDIFRGYAEFAEVREKIREITDVDETMAFIHEGLRRGAGPIVLLASGDPLFFGIGRRAVREFGRDAVEVIPDVSSIQLAFSRIGESWEKAFFVSLHGSGCRRQREGGYALDDLSGLLATHDTLAILTDRENNPAVIARAVATAARRPCLLFHVCERLGYDDERITAGTADEIAAMSFNDPNVVIITRTDSLLPAGTPPLLPRFGLREEEIAHSGGLITKDEVRAVTIHALRLPGNSVLWDVGAGSGAVSVEAARLCPGLHVFAVEKDEGQLEGMRKNKGLFGVENLSVVEGEAPSALASLPAPCRVFIGGSGGRLEEIIDVAARRMEDGIIVINAGTIETLNAAIGGLERARLRVRVSQVSVARSKKVGDKRYLAALNPVFVIVGEKG